jgi:hypothetical protein
MKKNLIVFLISCLCIGDIFAQKKPVLKIELPFALDTYNGSAKIIYPTLYIPVHKHIDIGFSYNSINNFYGGYTYDPNSFSQDEINGKVNYKFPSLYLKLNASSAQRRMNPFIGYIISFIKGQHEFLNEYYGSEYNVDKKMTASEQAILETKLNQSQIAHGLQIGTDVKLSPTISLFFKAQSFSLKSITEDKGDFYLAYFLDGGFQYAESSYAMGGIVLKIGGGNKSKIK